MTYAPKIRVEDLMISDLVNLENDVYADSDGNNIEYVYHYGEVVDKEFKNVDGVEGVEVTFQIDGGYENVVVFPLGHMVKQ